MNVSYIDFTPGCKFLNRSPLIRLPTLLDDNLSKYAVTRGGVPAIQPALPAPRPTPWRLGRWSSLCVLGFWGEWNMETVPAFFDVYVFFLIWNSKICRKNRNNKQTSIHLEHRHGWVWMVLGCCFWVFGWKDILLVFGSSPSFPPKNWQMSVLMVCFLVDFCYKYMWLDITDVALWCFTKIFPPKDLDSAERMEFPFCMYIYINIYR